VDVEKFRATERERQRRHRAKQKVPAGPAPPQSTPLPESLRREIEKVLDLALGASRPSRSKLAIALMRLASGSFGSVPAAGP
jgi:hypothetical protein